MTKTRIDEALANVPIFPLPNVVLFPEARLPLHIFEPRYRQMLADALEAGGGIVIAQIDRSGGRIANVAGAGLIIEHQQLPDGRSNIVVAGSARVKLDELAAEVPPRFPYKRARASRLVDLDMHVDDTDRAALLGAASMFASEVRKHDPSFSFRLPNVECGRATAAGLLADLCAFQLVVDGAVRQTLLEELDPRARVRMVTEQLATQQGAMRGTEKGAVLN